ncbi:MAG: elongation factor G [Candidatus Hydrothermales bacterium]
MDISKIRNIGFAAHIDAGKTTTTERILFYTHRIHRMGEVDEGTATMDYMIQEKERGITIQAAATFCEWKNYLIHIVDTPGHVDFTVEVERSMRILDGLVIIFSAVEGVEPQSETIWRQAEKFNVPRIAFINKMDRQGADHLKVLNQIEKKFKIKPLLLEWPVGLETQFLGVFHFVENKKILWDKDELGIEYSFLPIDSLKEDAKNYYEDMIITLSEIDESIADEYYEKGFVNSFKVNNAIRKGVLEKRFLPVLIGSALKNKGIQPLLDAICEYLPSPIDRGKIRGIDPLTRNEIFRNPDPNDHFSGVVFKVQIFEDMGKLCYVRIYSGKISQGEKIYNPRTNEVTRIQRLYRLHANKKNAIREAICGEIVGIVGPKEIKTGDTICSHEHSILYEEMLFPEPVVSQAIEPISSKDFKKIEERLKWMVEEDPTFNLKIDEETGQIIISGMGELHLEIILDRLKRDHKLDFRALKPQVHYRESISISGEIIKEIKKNIGGEEQYGKVLLKVEPIRSSMRNEILIDENLNLEGELKEVAYSSMKELLDFGVIAGYPLIDVKMILKRVYNIERTTPLGLRLAIHEAGKELIKTSEPVLLEPYSYLEITVPHEFIGNVIQDLMQREAEIIEKDILQGFDIIKIVAEMPLKNTFGYVTVLRSHTKGKAGIWMKVSSFREAKLEKKEFLY